MCFWVEKWLKTHFFCSFRKITGAEVVTNGMLSNLPGRLLENKKRQNEKPSASKIVF